VQEILDVFVSRYDTRRHDMVPEDDSGPLRGARHFRMRKQEGLDSSVAPHLDTGETDLVRRAA
jgi:hypothetical protein